MVQQELRGEDADIMNKTAKSDAVGIVLVGDPGVGKTSLIYSLVNDDFEANLPARMADITIPAELLPENVPMCIVDYSEREQTCQDLKELISQASLICIVYVAGDPESLERVGKHWIPAIRECQKDQKTYKPLILVANKIDLLEEDEEFAEGVAAIMQEFVDVGAFIEVSALSQKNVVELFSSAQKTITYPLSPLFDPQMRVLTKSCSNALIEIFRLSDHDGDGLLNDHELNLFQENCFGTPLQKDALDDLKLIIKQSTIDGIKNDSLTLAGFLFLHTLSIDKGRIDFTWQVLRKFNYDNQVRKQTDSFKLVENSNNDLSQRDTTMSDYGPTQRQDQSGVDDFDATSESMNDMDKPWLRDHKNTVKTGLGLTVITLLSFLALRFLHSSFKNSVS